MNKSLAQKKHTIVRAKKRYGITLDKFSINTIVGSIQNGEAEFVCRQSNRVSLWFVHYNDKKLLVVYDNKRKSIATVLPPDVKDDYLKNVAKRNAEHDDISFEVKIDPKKLKDQTLNGFLPDSWFDDK